MEIFDIPLPSTSQLAEDYKRGERVVSSFFHYKLQEKDVYEKRKKDLAHGSYPREELVEYLLSYNEKCGADEQTLSNILKLKDPRSVVVVGGQQAGILTGPMYTIHKILSILKLAKQQEEKLQIPVLPVFWIAGEDHDFAEINHVFVKEKNAVLKKTIPQKVIEKKMASDLPIDHSKCAEWLQAVFQALGETNHSKQLLELIKDCLKPSYTYVEFFSRLTLKLFAGSGLILMDSASEQLRKIESSFFVQIIEENKKLSEALLQQQQLVEERYPRSIHVEEQTAHLFYYANERILLERSQESKEEFVGKNNEVTLTKEKLLHIARTEPQLLSNNVVTRPLMQEFLLPTLAFIAGPGEIAYWAELKKAFELFKMKVPPIVPRLSYVFIERYIERCIESLELTVERVLLEGIQKEKEQWLKENVKYPYEIYFETAKSELEAVHRNLRENILKEDETFSSILEKNRNILQTQLELIRKLVESKQLTKHEVTIRKFNDIEDALTPMSLPQERIWNIFHFLNVFGTDFVTKVSKLDVEFNHKLKVVRL